MRLAAAAARRGRRDHAGDDAGSLPIALLVTLVGVSLSALLSTMVVNQIGATRHSSDRVQAVDAAQAGLDVGLAHIRAAFDDYGGDRRKLPCGPLKGKVGAVDTTAPAWYEVSIDYYLVDPSGHQDNLSAIAASRVNCTAAGAAVVPAYALVRARGTGAGDTDHNGVRDAGAGPWRSIYATYTFFTSEENIPGGVIELNQVPYCLGTNSSAPASGMALTTVPCDPEGATNTWIYPKNLTLVLARTRTVAAPRGLCLHANSQTDGALVTLRACAAVTDFHQQWVRSVGQTYVGTADGKTASGFCIHAEPAGSVNATVLLRGGATCDGTSFNSSKTWMAESTVGAGAAGADTGQLVNFGEVGRCVDLPRDDVTGVSAFGAKKPALITYPCKQAFDGVVHWNHKWKMPTIEPGEFSAEGRISVTPTFTPPETADPFDGVEHCMKSPGPAGGNVWVVPCSEGGTALDWTIYTRAPTVEQAYQVTDVQGNCMQAIGPGATPAQKLDAWSFVVTAQCNGSDLQKWNVPASFANGPLKALGED